MQTPYDRGILSILSHIFYKLTEFFNLKIYTGAGALVYGFFFGDLPYAVATAVVMLVLMDMATGLIASKRSGVVLTSGRAFATAVKLAIYGILISAGHLTNTVIGFDFKLDEAIMVVLALTELISILENCGNMGYAVPKRLLNQLHEWRDGK